MQPTISVVIPVYNSQDSLAELVPRLEAVLRPITTAYEILLINDGSRDRSWDMICELADRVPAIRGINLMRNYGQHNALLCGIRAARYDLIVTVDDDLQHPPEEIPQLLQKFNEGYDVVYGTPQQEQHGFWRDLASQLTKFVLQNAMGAEIARHISPFRIFRTQLRAAFAEYRGAYVSIDVLLTWGASRFAAVRVAHAPRMKGVSNYTVRKLISHALNMVTGFSVFPLQLASFVGFGLTLFGGGVLMYVLARYLISGSVVPGFPFLASVIAVFSGAQLFALGIMGEYLARMHFRIIEKPSYVVRTVHEQEE